MKKTSPTVRITLALTFVATTVVLLAQVLELIPDRRSAVVEGRIALCEAISINSSAAAASGNMSELKENLEQVVRRNPDLLSAGVRRNDGKLIVASGDHESHWRQNADTAAQASHLFVPLSKGNSRWGTVELRFRPLARGGWLGYLENPLVRLLLFVGPMFFLVGFLFLKRTLKQLNPSKVVPKRVRQALDTLTGGLLVLDQNERIVLANKSFSDTVGLSVDELQGRKASQLEWNDGEARGADNVLPWHAPLRDGTTCNGAMLSFKTNGEPKTFLVNATPIVGDDGQRRGVLTSFDDVTALKKKQIELTKMLDLLRNSRDEVRRQNRDLQMLATRDPLTHCLNRRSLFDAFEKLWQQAPREGQPLSCVMIDIDHFKAINDNHGHATGDEVLQRVAAALNDTARDSDLVARYGGEEFCIVLPGLAMDQAADVAERFRQAIERVKLRDLRVTASFGLSEAGFGARDPQQLLEQADKSLYAAKRTGRNRVVRWDRIASVEERQPAAVPSTARVSEEPTPDIPFHAVTALTAALGYRHADTAEHSRRVADYCVATARDLMPVRDAYVLEMAALLHDIGKIGVPDAILLKPGPLTEDEWKFMSAHDRIGVEIIRTTFSCAKLTEIIETHHAWFGGNPRDPSLPVAGDIPVSARILAIADAYDAIVSNRVYRKGRDQHQAFAELRRCAGRQFDPELVERFIQAVEARDANREVRSQSVTKQTALQFGLQIERLTEALERHDLTGLSTLAGRLNDTAQQCGAAEISQIAAQLQEVASADDDMQLIVELTRDLLDVCRSTQRAYLEQCHNPVLETEAAAVV